MSEYFEIDSERIETILWYMESVLSKFNYEQGIDPERLNKIYKCMMVDLELQVRDLIEILHLMENYIRQQEKRETIFYDGKGEYFRTTEQEVE